MPSQGGSLRIGIEMELLLTHHEATSIPDLDTLANGFIAEYEASVRNGYPRVHSDIDGVFDGDNDMKEWSLTDDVTVKPTPGSSDQWPLEIVSPIFHFAPHGQWRGSVIALWEFLSGFYTVRSNTTCSTHVHVSPLEGWQLEQVKGVARTVIYFENAVEILVPEHRRGNEYSKSNRLSNPKFAGCVVAECIEMINQCDSTANVANLMNADGDRYYGWNFCNLFYGGKGTIEFRRGPGAQSAFGALCWVEFAVSILQAAIIYGTSQNLRQYPSNVGGLKQFIDQAYVENMNDRGYLNPIFDEKDPKSYLEPRLVAQLPPAKQAMLDAKKSQDEKKNLIMKKIEKNIFAS